MPFFVWLGYILSVLYLFGIVSFIASPVSWIIFLGFIPLFLITSFLEGEKGMFKYLIPYLVFIIFTWLITIPAGFIKFIRRDTSWAKTPHGQ